MDPVSISEARSICRKFVFRKGEEKRILAFKRIGRKFIQDLSKEKIKPSKIFALLEPLSYEVILMLKAKYKNRQLQKHIEDFFEIYNGMRICISGEDLHRLGVEPGPYYQKIFAKVLNAKLNGLVKTREDELALIKKLIKVR
jgi:tRNA nucleotidyltransferase (CCA-adding enzyme)